MANLLDLINQTPAHALAARALGGHPMRKGGGPFVGPKGGKWADAKHTIPWKEGKPASKQRKHAHAGSTGGWHNDHKNTTGEQHDRLQHRHHALATTANHAMSKQKKDSNAEFAHRYERDYHLAMADAHGTAKVGKLYGPGGKLEGHHKTQIDSALKQAREAKWWHLGASKNVERDKLIAGGMSVEAANAELNKSNPEREATMSSDQIQKGGGPFIGSRGGKWADPQHKIPWNDKKHAGKPAPKARDHDKHGATELQLHIENTAGHQNQHESIRDNLAKKIAAGKYDHAQASKLFQYLADSGSKQYAKEHGSGSGHAMDVPTRQAAARQMAHDFHDEVKYGEHDHRVSSGVHAKRAKAGGGLAAMAHAHGSGNAKKSEPTRRIAANLPYDDHIMSFYKG